MRFSVPPQTAAVGKLGRARITMVRLLPGMDALMDNQLPRRVEALVATRMVTLEGPIIAMRAHVNRSRVVRPEALGTLGTGIWLLSGVEADVIF